MKNLTHILLLTFLLNGNVAFSQPAEKTLISSIHPNEHTNVEFNIDGKVDIERWNGEIIKVQTLVSIPNVHEAVLKSLVTAGRYRLAESDESGHLQITSPGLKKQVSLGGKPLEEHISYLIFIPEHLTITDAGVGQTEPLQAVEN